MNEPYRLKCLISTLIFLKTYTEKSATTKIIITENKFVLPIDLDINLMLLSSEIEDLHPIIYKTK